MLRFTQPIAELSTLDRFSIQANRYAALWPISKRCVSDAMWLRVTQQRKIDASFSDKTSGGE